MPAILIAASLALSLPTGETSWPDGPGPIRLDEFIAPASLLLPAALPLPFCGACEDTALAAFGAETTAARADYFVAVGNCINEGGHPLLCAVQLLPEWFAARQHANAVYGERLALCQAIGSGAYDPMLAPQQFSPDITNQYFPLVPGRVLVYRKSTAEGVERTRVKALDDTIEIAGIECRVVRDVVRIDGELLEDTLDWYAQDQQGNVWYLGEIAKNYEDGVLTDLGGSWTTAVDHAKPGIVMRAAPQVGETYRQEFLLGEAEDVGRVLALGVTVTVPYGTFTNCLQTEDFTPLEPGVREHKFYAPGIGAVLTINLATGERAELVDVIEP
ncbi:MAG: hypothetical protein KDE27_21590 [Planctomycetes bacterium]|nr:hypothetical protein [Planctomycetota bacterium]